MAAVYANLIIKGKKTIDDVPDSLKAAVTEILVEKGYIQPDPEDADETLEKGK